MVWSMFFEFFVRIAMLDVPWLVNLIATNWVYLFMFFVLAFFLFEKKNLIVAFLFLTFMVWITLDFTRALGWVIVAPAFLLLHYASRLIVLTFAEADEALKPHFNIIAVLQFLVVYIFYNIFIG